MWLLTVAVVPVQILINAATLSEIRRVQVKPVMLLRKVREDRVAFPQNVPIVVLDGWDRSLWIHRQEIRVACANISSPVFALAPRVGED